MLTLLCKSGNSLFYRVLAETDWLCIALSGECRQHNGWGERTPVAEQTLSFDGKRGPTACFATQFWLNYSESVLRFIKQTGLGGLETDGQYEDIPCWDSGGDHYHNGIAGGYSYGLKATLDFNIKLKALGVYQTGADAYRYSGANRWNHADTDAFGHLPLWEQHEVGRMYTYDSTMTRLASSGQLGVNDLSTFSKTCDGTNGRSRMLCFDFVLAGYWGWGVVGDFRSARLYDPTDSEAALLAATIKGWTKFYRNYTKPRPSGAAGVLLADQIHIKRPDARSISAMASVTADTSLPERALLTALNPTLETQSENLSVPLYCTCLPCGICDQ